MPSFSSLFHHKKPSDEGNDAAARKAAEAAAESSSQPQQSAPPAYAETEQPATRATVNPVTPQYVAPQFAPGTGPIAHGQMVAAERLGQEVGLGVGLAAGSGVGMGMVEGQVGANMIMQTVQHAQKQLYYREQALNYRAGLPADGVGAAGGLAPAPSGGRDRRSRSQRREERRKARWERRAKRRDGGGATGDHEASSGSESDGVVR